jgi:RNA polymerase sigma factor (sigma-70 family)
MPGRPTDAELIDRSLRDPPLFREVFERHYDDVRRYLQRRSGSDAGEELAAQTFEQAFRFRSRFDPSHADARPWLMGIATNILHHHYRAESIRLRALERAASFSPEVPVDDPDARMDAQATAPALARALRELSQGERDVLLLYAWSDLSYDEIARALDVPIGTVRSRLHRARRHLREPVTLDEATGGDER